MLLQTLLSAPLGSLYLVHSIAFLSFDTVEVAGSNPVVLTITKLHVARHFYALGGNRQENGTNIPGVPAHLELKRKR